MINIKVENMKEGSLTCHLLVTRYNLAIAINLHKLELKCCGIDARDVSII